MARFLAGKAFDVQSTVNPVVTGATGKSTEQIIRLLRHAGAKSLRAEMRRNRGAMVPIAVRAAHGTGSTIGEVGELHEAAAMP